LPEYQYQDGADDDNNRRPEIALHCPLEQARPEDDQDYAEAYQSYAQSHEETEQIVGFPVKLTDSDAFPGVFILPDGTTADADDSGYEKNSHDSQDNNDYFLRADLHDILLL
jgi:hypothetical protein